MTSRAPQRPNYFTSMSAARHTDAELVRAIREVVVMILRDASPVRHLPR